MSIGKIEVKANIHGRRRMLFERYKAPKEITSAALVREALDYFLKHKLDSKA